MSGRVLRLLLPHTGRFFSLRPSAFICVCLHASALVCVSLHLSACVCTRLRSSAFICVHLRTSVYICEPSTKKSNFNAIKHIQESSKVSQGYASSERCKFVGGVSETVNRVSTVFLDLEKLPTWGKDCRGERLKA